MRTILKLVYTAILMLYCQSSIGQNFENNCELTGDVFGNSQCKYKGMCSNNEADGWGQIICNGGNIQGNFWKKNKIQNLFMDYYWPGSGNYRFGPNLGSSFHGPCFEVFADNTVQFWNYNNDKSAGNSWDYFQIPSPEYQSNVSVGDLEYKNRKQVAQIPNSKKIIYLVGKEYNNNGDRKFYVHVLDISTNTLVHRFGNFTNPIIIQTADKPQWPVFLGFSKDNNYAYYEITQFFQDPKKYLICNLATGAYEKTTKLPYTMSSSLGFMETCKSKTITDLDGDGSTLDRAAENKYLFTDDSDYIKVFNKPDANTNTIYSGAYMVIFNKNHTVKRYVKFPNAYISDFAFDRNLNRIAINYGTKDSIYLKYYNINDLNEVTILFEKPNPKYKRLVFGKVLFSKTGTYLYYVTGEQHISIYHRDKLYYGAEGNIICFNQNDNILIIDNKWGKLYACDLEKKSIIWQLPINSMSKEYYIYDKEFYFIPGDYQSSSILKIKIPEPLVNLSEFARNPLFYTNKTSDANNSNVAMNGGSSSNNQVNKISANSDGQANLLLLYFMKIALESARNSNYTSASIPASSPRPESNANTANSAKNCYTCNGTGKCQKCKNQVKKPYYDGKCGWPERNEIKLGHVLCSNCHGKGYSITNNQFFCDCRDGIGWCPEKKCTMNTCHDGWDYCKDCNPGYKGNNIGQCNSCRGTGKRN